MSGNPPSWSATARIEFVQQLNPIIPKYPSCFMAPSRHNHSCLPTRSKIESAARDLQVNRNQRNRKPLFVCRIDGFITSPLLGVSQLAA